MRSRSLPVIAMLLLAGSIGSLAAQDLPAKDLPPIQLSRLPHLAIISPTFTWDNQSNLVRTISATCPGGRPIGGGIGIEKGNGSLRISESYPDGASWVIRAANRGSTAKRIADPGAGLRGVPAAGGPRRLGADRAVSAAVASVAPVRAGAGQCHHGGASGLRAEHAGRVRRLRARPRVQGPLAAAHGAQLSGPVGLERPRQQWRGGRAIGGGCSRLRSLPRQR